jgi:hypothetical protein
MVRADRVIARAHSQNLTVIADVAMSLATVALAAMVIALTLTPG